MMDDFRIRGFRNHIIGVINEEPLPLEVKRLVLKDILDEVSVAADNSIKSFIAAEKEKANTENSPE